MLGMAPITTWHWAAFIAGVLAFVAFDLFVVHRSGKPITFKGALTWTCVCVAVALIFGAFFFQWRGKEEGMEFFAGYIIELSLSMDNVFVLALIFGYFRVPIQHQYRVLVIGFINALIMRGTVIGLGSVLIARFHWILYIMGAFLIYSGVKMLLTKEEGVHPEKNPVLKLARKLFPISPEFEGGKFITRSTGTLSLTPLAVVIMMTETTDLVFAVDSIPAIFAVTQKPFIVFTSNILAIIGLRSLYFVLVGAIQYFKYLKFGLSLVLVFVGLKMVLEMFHIEISIFRSLMVVAGLILGSMAASLLLMKRDAEVVPGSGD